MRCLYSLACWFLLLGISIGAAKEQQHDSTGTLEVGLVFPRNESTINPSIMMPFVFSYQNAKLLPILKPYFIYHVYNYSNTSQSIFDGRISSRSVNVTADNDPHFEVNYHRELNTEGKWLLTLVSGFFYCFEDPNRTFNNTYTIDASFAKVNITFTTKGPSQQVDPAAVAHSKNCSSAAGLTINVQDTVKTPQGDRRSHELESDVCPLEPSATLADECVAVVPSVASSIAAEITTRVCKYSWDINKTEKPDGIDCESLKEKENGKLIDSGVKSSWKVVRRSNFDMDLHITKSFYAFTIPTVWRISDLYAFVLDSAYDCNKQYPVEDYVTKEAIDTTSICVEERRYYLVYPKEDGVGGCHNDCKPGGSGDCEKFCQKNKFIAPPRVSSLNGTGFGGITVKDLIEGSVSTYNRNGKKNTADPLGRVADSVNLNELFDLKLTTPGILRLPVCSPERAYKSWDTTSKGSSPFYPCDIPPGKKSCKESTFQDDTSNASPLVSDCKIMIKKFEEDGGINWKPEIVGLKHMQLRDHGTCVFGVEATKLNGNIYFHFGGGDLIEYVKTAIEKYSKGGKIGASGTVQCSANTSKSQPIKWGIYHT